MEDYGDEYFGDDYLLLKPREASTVDLFGLLVSSDPKEHKKFINAPDPDHLANDLISFRRRWLLFVSVVAQKLLLLAGGPMELIGNAIETWLNLLSFNGGLLNLLANLCGLNGSGARA